ncbi:hypothetical protein BKA70DRAFT_1463419 [Coprinopsis sp. MPI-PUGE-AT-0042]|nr:hypothetical protein BKA70DRAFT_1463419 [Coprinopsis sp. MPI-PUGE-AT-0042]
MGDARGPFLEKPQCNITLHCEASAVAFVLIVLAGLDPASATRSDMDARDARFAVAADIIPTWWTSEYLVLTWRGALHCFAEEHYKEGRPTPQFRLATRDELNNAREDSDKLVETQKVWSCNHCQQFWSRKNAQSRPSVLSHVIESHAITQPKSGEDYLVNPFLWPLVEAPCRILLQFTTDLCFRCSRCRQPNCVNGEQMFDLDGITQHLHQIHQSSPAPGSNFALDTRCVTGYPG